MRRCEVVGSARAERFFIVAITGMLLVMAVVADAAGEADGEDEFGEPNCGLCEWIIGTPPDREEGYDTGERIMWSSDADVQDFGRNTYNIFRYIWNYHTKDSRVVHWINGGIGADELKSGQIAYVCHSGLVGYTLESGNIYYKGNANPEQTTAYRGVLEEQGVLDLRVDLRVQPSEQDRLKLRTAAGITEWTPNGGHRACEGHQRILFTTEITVEDDEWKLRYLIQNQSCALMPISIPDVGARYFDASERRLVEVAVSVAPKAGCLPVTFGSDNAVTVRVPTFIPADWAGCPDEDR